jgi:hypothetical protein
MQVAAHEPYAFLAFPLKTSSCTWQYRWRIPHTLYQCLPIKDIIFIDWAGYYPVWRICR